jgi:hypothetical protein
MALTTADQPFFALNRFTGRTEDTLVYISPQGIKHTVHPSELVEFFVPGMRQFQFEQTSPNTLLLRISVHDGYSDTKLSAEKKLKDILVKTNIEKFVTGKVALVDSIGLNSKTGKFKLVIPYC